MEKRDIDFKDLSISLQMSIIVSLVLIIILVVAQLTDEFWFAQSNISDGNWVCSEWMDASPIDKDAIPVLITAGEVAEDWNEYHKEAIANGELTLFYSFEFEPYYTFKKCSRTAWMKERKE